MSVTILKYLEDFTLLESEAMVVEILKENDRDVVVLDETIFYPQGGGQPYDQGVMESNGVKFIVEEVRFFEGMVKHIGKFENGTFQPQERVGCAVNAERRILHARIHSAGHLVDKSIQELGLPWTPGKGYHFPDGPYDEYAGSLEGLDAEKIKADIERLCNGYVQKGGKTGVEFMTREQMKEVCHYKPDFAESKGDVARVVIHGGYYMPCGGTPVVDLSEIRKITIRKVKQKGENIRVGYDIEK